MLKSTLSGVHRLGRRLDSFSPRESLEDFFECSKIDPDNQMYFMDITGLRVVIRNCSLFEQNPKWHHWQKES